MMSEVDKEALSGLKQASEDIKAKLGVIGDSLANEFQILRQEMGSKPSNIDFEPVLAEVRQLHQSFETELHDLEAKVNVLGEVGKLREDIESRFGIKFDRESFTQDDVYSFLFATSNALYRFDRETKSKEGDENSLTEARGYVAILNLALAWARANENDTMKKQVNELFPRAEGIFERMNEL